MKSSPEELERLVHETLRSLPPRRAPRTLEARVHAAIEARAARAWWRQPYPHWPAAARIGFGVFSSVAAAAVIVAAMGMAGGLPLADRLGTGEVQIDALDTAQQLVRATWKIVGSLVERVPSGWFHGALAVLAVLYATLFGLGATAYRTLCAHR